MHKYRTHTCGALRGTDAGNEVKLSGWVHRKRNHGGLLFIDLRDHYGITQCVINQDSEIFDVVEKIRLENVVCFKGEVLKRTAETINKDLPTGEIEVRIKSYDQLSEPVEDMLPLQVNSEEPYGEDVRLKYRFLDLRRDSVHRNIVMRSDVIASMRKRMWAHNFREYQTPILTASSPEGARDFLVPSRLHPGKFYALPQAPQQFKQLLMIGGFDKYFQIAPCFRDEDARADRAAGEFYQLDMEMSFVEQGEIFTIMEDVIGGVLEEFSSFTGRKFRVDKGPFIHIPYDESMLKYGSDKPDLRNPLIITDVTEIFKRDDVEFKAFKNVVAAGGVVRAIRAPKVSDRPRSFFDKLNTWAQEQGAPGLGYIVFEAEGGKGPIAKFIPAVAQEELKKLCGAEAGDAMFFVCDQKTKAVSLAGKARNKIAEEMDIVEKDVFRFCWIVDFPMYEVDETTGKVDFSHNPFSMPQGGIEALKTKNPLEIKAFQYDCVLNGIELCSGGIRNHIPEAMETAFEIAGYSREEVHNKFQGMYNAFKLGAPPHGGCAFGIDRLIMFIADQNNVREIITFPLNQQGEDLMMGAPSIPDDIQLKEVHIKTNVLIKK